MDRTEELTHETLGTVSTGQTVDRGTTSSVAGVVRRLRARSHHLEGLAGTALECLLDTLGFERGFFLAEGAGGDEIASLTVDGRRFQVFASSRLCAEGGKSRGVPITNPECAITSSIVARSLLSPDPIAVNDSLVPPGPGAPDGEADRDRHRAVLCRSFPLTRAKRCVLYVDRGLGQGPLGRAEKEAFGDLAQVCVPLVAQAVLAEEVARLSGRLDEGRPQAAGPAGEEEDLETGADIDSGVDRGTAPQPLPSYHGLVGRSQKLAEVVAIVEKVKDSDLNVCIAGESGTGKELVARALHNAGKRSQSAFVSENCGAIAENLLESELFGHVKGAFTGAQEDRQGLFELANRGTLFLDEIGDMPEVMQRKLLRVLQEGTIRPIGGKESIRVDVRVVCASNRDLKLLVEEGSFRTDLFYRLNVISLRVPPLRERLEDLPLLVEQFLRELASEDGVERRMSASALVALGRWSWPGNVRELRNLVRRVGLTSTQRVVRRRDVVALLDADGGAVCIGKDIRRDDEHLVLRVPVRHSFNEIIDECERLVIENALEQNGWNKSRVTKVLGIPRQSLYNKIARYGLEQRGPAEESADAVE